MNSVDKKEMGSTSTNWSHNTSLHFLCLEIIKLVCIWSKVIFQIFDVIPLLSNINLVYAEKKTYIILFLEHFMRTFFFGKKVVLHSYYVCFCDDWLINDTHSCFIAKLLLKYHFSSSNVMSFDHERHKSMVM